MKNSRKGFTLVELLVVIAILGILGAVTIVGYSGFKRKGEVQSAKTELTSLKDNVIGHDDDIATYSVTASGLSFEDGKDFTNALQDLIDTYPDDFTNLVITKYEYENGKVIYKYSSDVTVSWNVVTGTIEEE